MEFIYNKPTSAKAIADLRESVGWNRMESSYSNPLLTSYYHISVYEAILTVYRMALQMRIFRI